jgi:hypothetical protein
MIGTGASPSASGSLQWAQKRPGAAWPFPVWEVGALLWDGEYGYAKFLAHEKATQPARNWSALYQQQLAPESGNYFQDEWLKPYDKVPPRETLKIYGASDYAVTENGDFTARLLLLQLFGAYISPLIAVAKYDRRFRRSDVASFPLHHSACERPSVLQDTIR